jgi:hypothetical protein
MQDQASATVTFNIPSTPPRFLSVKDCAKSLKVSYKQALYLMTRDDGPKLFYITPRCIRIPYEAFIGWINSKAKDS